MILSTKYDGIPLGCRHFCFWLRLLPGFLLGFLLGFKLMCGWYKPLTWAEFGKFCMAKILIVEDDEFLADLMQDCLLASNYDVQSVNTGGDALKHLESSTYSVVLLDWQLPDMEGLDVLKAYRQNKGTAKVVLLTGMRGRKNDGIESGADKFLTKPFKIEEILATVKEFAPDAQ